MGSAPTVSTNCGASTAGWATLVDLLRDRAACQGNAVAFVALRDGEVEEARLTYAELERRARAIAARLQREGRPGERALLLYPSGLEYICAFFGCLFAGVVAVPTYPPTSQRSRSQRVDGIVRDAGATWLLGDSATLAALDADAWPDLRRLATSDVTDAEAAHWIDPAIDGGTLAFLQYTSGSTGDAKGVMVSHANLLHNEALIQRAFGTDANAVVVGWLPLYHDMGLIGNVLHPLFLGARAVLMSPMAFLQKPLRWLQAIAAWGGTVSGGPDFAYALCAERVSPEQRAGLDLSRWRVAFNGAEPIRAATLQRFGEAFAECGFDASAFFPCYGLAEATLFVSGGDRQAPVVQIEVDAAALGEDRYVPAGQGATRRLVSSGAFDPAALRIVDAQGDCLGDACVGEIWLRGASVARGYWQRPEASADAFAARTASGEGPFLRTGDLGFVRDGRLYVTGRLKELVIVRGRNHYPQDIEQTVQASAEAFVAGGGAAFAIEQEGEERLVVVQEVQRSHLRRLDADALIAAARSAVAAAHEIPLHDLLLIGPMRLPKTSSGKIQRRRAQQMYLAGEFERLAAGSPLASRRSVDAPTTDLAPADAAESALQAWVRAQAADCLRVPPAALQAQRPLLAQGLDSLAAIQLQHRLQEAHGVDVSLDALLGGATLVDLAGSLRDADRRPSAAWRPSGRDAGPLSGNQQSMWFLHGLHPDSSAHTLIMPVRLRAPLRADLLQPTWDALARQHAVLRTVYDDRDGEPRQRIAPGAGPQITWVDAADLDDEAIDAAIAAAARAPWRLDVEAPFRLTAYRERDGGITLLLCAHHIAADLWTLVLLWREWLALYAAHCADPAADPADHAVDAAAEAPASACSSIDFALWQQAFTASPRGREQLAYWVRRLGGGLPVLHLPTDRARSRLALDAGAACDFRIDAATGTALRALARRAGATPYAVLLAAYALLLHKLGGDEELCIGTPTYGRRSDFAALAGFCANTVVIRAVAHGGRRFLDLVADVAAQVRAALENQDVPFAQVVEAVAPRREPGVTPLFQTLFTLHQPQGLPEAAPFLFGVPGARWTRAGVTLESRRVPCQGSAFDLSLLMVECDDGYAARFEYRTALFDDARIDRIARRFAQLLRAIVAAPEARLGALALHSGDEQRALLRAGACTPLPLPRQSVAARVEAVAAAHPQALALVCGDETLTYAELDRRAGALAAALRAEGVTPGERVALCLPRGVALYLAVLAAVKLGAAYVPIDPAYPAARRRLILDLARPRLLLRQGGDGPGLDVDRLLRSELSPLRGVAPAHADLPLYLMYTSGSTGAPKGVLMRQGALLNLLDWQRRGLPLDAGAAVTQFAAIGFDVSFQEIFSTWQDGGRLVVVDEAARHDPAALLRLWRQQAVVRAFLPVVVLQQVAQQAVQDAHFPAALREVICAGEQLVVTADVRVFFAQLPAATLHNHYGPTETHVVTSHVLRAPAQEWPSHPPIGRPIDCCALHLLDADGAPVAEDGIGEICVGGVPLALGYFGRGDLSAERFVPDPSGLADGARLYRTGDLARRDRDGCLHYLGRRDQQVQLRGFRVELAEIEAALLALPGVHEAVVVLREDDPGRPRLVAYVAGAEAAALDWRRDLGERLPPHMVPAHCVVLAALPLTPNGKVDKRALPVPDVATDAEDRVAPRSDLEARISARWGELLGIAAVGVHDDFFASGGHSLLGTRLIAALRRDFAIDLPVTALFEAPTVAGLAERVAAAPPASVPPPAAVPREGGLPLSYAQQRLWFLDQLEGPSPNYNMPAAFRLRGPLDVAALRTAFAEIVRRHEILRTRFIDGPDGPLQQVDAPEAFALPVVDVAAERVPALLRAHAQQPFDLRAGGLLRAELLRLAADDHVLAVNLHHIVADGWSIGVMVREMNLLYAAACRGAPAALDPLPLQYGDYAVWQRQWLQGGALARQIAYWRERLADLPPLLEIPGDRPRPPVQSLRAAVHRFDLDAATMAGLQALGRRHGVTLLATLMSAFQVLLARHSGQHDIAVGTPVANRDRAEVQELIGFFVNTVVLRQRVEPHQRFADLLQQVQRDLQAAQAHQDLPFEQLVEELKPARSLSHMPLVQVMLLLHDGAAAQLHLPGIEVARIDTGHAVARFDLALNLEPQGEGYAAWFDYAADLYDAARIESLAQRFRRLLAAVVECADTTVSRLPLLEPAAVAAQLLPQEALAAACCGVAVHRLFEDRAAAAPEALALVQGEQRLRYADLEERANRLAHVLRARGVGSEDHVGVWCERSPALLVALLAVWKCGGVYVPLDPAYPKERLDYIVRDANLRCVVADADLAERLPPPDAALVYPQHLVAELAASPPTRPDLPVHRLQPAYVIYTSGSTGRPKGVQVLHAGLGELLLGLQRRFAVTPRDSMLGVASQSFGIAFVELLLPLVTGGHTRILSREDVLDTQTLASALQQVTLAHLVPSLMRRVLDHFAAATAPAERGLLRQVFVGGDAVAPSLLADMAGTFPQVAVTEFYGQTETTILSTHAPQHGAPPSGNVIGTRLDHAQVYVLDAAQQLLPQGSVGEICIGGHGIARGYLGRPEQTAERFLPHPYSRQPGARLYRTGDLGRLRADGSIEYLGRSDFQVNIRGFRIELGEIESVLRAEAGVAGAVVDARDDGRGERRLVAYLVAAPGRTLDVAALRGRLREALPDYMMPAHFVVLDAFPLNANGKLDRRALPAPDPAESSRAYVAPRDDTERDVAALWAEVLGVARVGVDDNFFELGGHSLLAAQALARVRQQFGLALGVADFFEAQTVGAFAARLSAARREQELLACVTATAPDNDEEMESFTL